MIDTKRYQGPCYINGHRMWCHTCKEHRIYFDLQAGEWDWPYRCVHCDLGEPLANRNYPKRLRTLEVISIPLTVPINLIWKAISRLEDWLGDHIG